MSTFDYRHFEGTSMFLIYNDIIKNSFDYIKEFIEEAADNLDQKQKESNSNYESWRQEAERDPQIEDAWRFPLEDQLHKYYNIFPTYTFNPMLLVIYGFFESWMKKLCMLHHRKGFNKISVDDLAGNNYIEKSRRYLELVAGLSFDSKDEQWKRITLIQQIRNRIAHHSSNIKKYPEKTVESQPLYPEIRKMPEIELDGETGDFYIAQKSFLSNTIDLLQNYLVRISKALDGIKVVARAASLPNDMTAWGQEKTRSLMKDIIFLKEHGKVTVPRSMAWNLTKLYAFFTDGPWQPGDADLILEKGEEGLAELKQLYRGWDVDVDDNDTLTLDIPPNINVNQW